MRIGHYNNNLTALLNIGKTWAQYDLFADSLPKETVVYEKSPGFDTFTYYLLARDPFLLKKEWKSVKAQRLIFPLTCFLLSGGREVFLVQAMCLVTLIAYLLFIREMLLLLQHFSLTPLWALWGGLSAGIVLSNLYLLTETMSFFFTFLALRKFYEEKIVLSALVLSLALMTREACIVLIIGCCLQAISERRWKIFFFFSASVLPYIFWNAYIGPRIKTGTWPLLSSSGSFTIPFAGIFNSYVKAFEEQGTAFWNHGFLITPFVLISVFAFYLSLRCLLREKNVFAWLLLLFSLQQILFQAPMWEGFLNSARLSLGMLLLSVFLPVQEKRFLIFKGIVFLGILSSFLALIRSCRIPEDLLFYFLT
jgi:hypothetical protein